jgi:ribosomal protein S18 acetylase RimI-like enzyme
VYNLPLSGSEPVPFRRATFADMHHVWHIVYHAYRAYIPLLGRTPPTFLEDFDGHIAAKNLWLLDSADGVNAMVVLTPAEDHLQIQALCVNPDSQGQGLGQHTLTFAEAKARELGFSELRLYTNSKMERNLRIYRQWGFRETHRESYDWGKRVHMRKLLKAAGVIRMRQPALLQAAA